MGNDLLPVVGDQFEQFSVKVEPILAIENAVHAIHLVGDPACKHLRTITKDRKPCFRRLNAEPRDPRHELAHNEFKILGVTPRLNVPAHQ